MKIRKFNKEYNGLRRKTGGNSKLLDERRNI
jgi:hypothetical protein